MLLCLLNTVMNYISRICNEGERHPFNPCSPYQQSSFRTRIIRIFTDVIALWQCLLEKIIRSIRTIRVRKNKRQEDSTRYPFNPYNPCSKNTQLLI